MRAGRWAAAICALCACGGSSGGGGSVAPPIDDAGTTAPADDGGTDAGAPADAGSGDAGPIADGGTVLPPGDGGPADGGAPGDGGTVADECEGIVPAALGQSVTATFADSRVNTGCFNATSDEAGNVLFGQPFGAWEIFSPNGALTGAPSESFIDLFPQGTGFEGVTHNGGPQKFVRLSPGGVEQVQTPYPQFAGASLIARGWPDGLLAVANGVNPPECTLSRFGDDGSLIASGTSGVAAPDSCRPMAAASAPNGVVLLMVAGKAALDPNTPTMVGRWFDANLRPMTDFFLVATFQRGGPDSSGTIVSLRTQVNGDVAIQKDGAWIGVLPANGGTTMKPAPAWMKTAHDIFIVRGERAYAVAGQDFASNDPDPEIATINQLDLVSAKGKLCGTLTFPGVGVLSTGADGTVIGRSVAKGSCTRTWWPALLK